MSNAETRKGRKHLDAVSNGLGSQSMWMLVLALRGDIPGTLSITADTGGETDCVWSTGRRSTARQYFDEVIVPLCRGTHIEPVFVRAVDKYKNPLPDLIEMAKAGTAIPLYGSRKGQQRQSCTDKWKIRAIRQEARRRGATTLRCAQGIHFGEAARRTRGFYTGQKLDGRWSVYQDTIKVKKVERIIRWCSHIYPLIDLQLGRDACRKNLDTEGIPYLLSSECDFCPHKDLARWERTSPEKLIEIASIEASFNGEYFFTDKRIPLMQAFEVMRAQPPKQTTDFGCGNHHCGV